MLARMHRFLEEDSQMVEFPYRQRVGWISYYNGAFFLGEYCYDITINALNNLVRLPVLCKHILVFELVLITTTLKPELLCHT